MNLRLPISVVAAAALMQSAFATDPIIGTSFTPDPAPYVHGDTLYLFTGHDEDDAQYFKMKDWQLYSTTDMVNWTYRGTPMSTATFQWAKQGDNAWAAQAVERNGKWYWYICAEDTTKHLHGIGVGVADSPTGPYTDPLKRPLVPGDWGYIDPSVFIDDDGQAYLFWGNNGLWYARLNEDMISLKGEVGKLQQTVESFGAPNPEKRVKGVKYKDTYTEGPWFYKREGKYYLLYMQCICTQKNLNPMVPKLLEFNAITQTCSLRFALHTRMCLHSRIYRACCSHARNIIRRIQGKD